MALFNVSYDLNRPGQNYDGLIKALEAYGMNGRRILKSTWLIHTTETAEALFDRMRPFLDASDRVLIARMIRPYQGWLTEEDWAWIRARIDT